MTLPGFTAEAATHSRAALVNKHATQAMGHRFAGTVTMAFPVHPHCGPCPPWSKGCPNPNGYGCDICVIPTSPCPLPH
jgi:hypothetical protein